MHRYLVHLLSIISLTLSLSCRPWQTSNYHDAFGNKPGAIPSVENESRVRFEDQTQDIVGHAKRLIETNEREGAVLDQRWYTLKRFGKYQDIIFGASHVIFYGGLEKDVRRHLQHRYTSVVPVEYPQEPGEVRLFYGKREGTPYDLIIIGQNGREVALKTIIRLIYLAKFVDDETRQKYGTKILSFNESLRVFKSSVSAQQEFVAFFHRYGIRNPDAVMIGFRGDIRAILRDAGVEDPKSYSNESLRVNWYADANGMKVLLVSIDHNRIFASRSGELIRAILKTSNTPPSVAFLGIGGAIEEPHLVGTLVEPTVVWSADSSPAAEQKPLVHLIRNKAVDEEGTRIVHASVESVIVETTRWAAEMKKLHVRTVDQELFHIMDAINSSVNARETDVFAGLLVTDNVASDTKADVNLTLEYAEETIAKTVRVRREFLSKVLTKMGVLKRDATPHRRLNEIAR
jgi:hypothetical protein